MESIVRGIATYLFVWIVFRIAGKRTLAQITTFDAVLLLIISECTQQAMIGDDFSVALNFQLRYLNLPIGNREPLDTATLVRTLDRFLMYYVRTADRLPPLFYQAVAAVPEGGVGEVVRSGAGFHVLKVIEKRKPGLPGATVVQSHARHILLRPSAQMSEAAAVARLAEYKKRVESGNADFAQLAREHSADASAAKGGDLGWASPGLFVPEFEEAMNSLAPGKISDPVVSRFGVHLIQLVERRQATLSAREQREVARNMLREKKLDEAYVQWAQEVRGRAYVEFREPPQ